MQYKGDITFELVSKSNEKVVSKMPITKGVLNPFGVVNASAIIWFADATASMLLLETNPIEGIEGMSGFPLAININTNLMGNAKSGTFIATSTYIKKGNTVSVVNTIVKDLDGKTMADVTSNHVVSK
ncbi:MAG: PaaI family thioesterase [Saccharospirillaceae bacterium]|nr:PaaI family thioesterase [Saccharospirillaceae bacterium]